MGKLKDILTQPVLKTDSAKAGMQVVAGGYVLYLAYDMFRSVLAGEVTGSTTPAYLAAAVLAVGGIGIVIYALRRWFAAYKAQQEQLALEQTEETEE